MTKMFVQEYAGLAFTAQSDSIPVPAEPPLASYVVDYTSGVASGPVYQAATKYLTIENDSIASVTFNGTPATVNDKLLFTALPTPLLVCVAGVPGGKASAITGTG
jgi:hypothetical protein